ncbi:hypothetical protein [Nocardia cyriacigeorgica]|uniref:hypothetical protein n=1 Tax=Nocardia cyriacigeorgica TaxID=135487 RepID=UPI0021153DD9|nr:hypothetical protein [Nocardia cyriacigeorgica]
MSGVVEILLGGMVALPATRDLGGWLAATLLAVYLLIWLDRLRGASQQVAGRRAAAAGVAVDTAYFAWGGYVAVAGG